MPTSRNAVVVNKYYAFYGPQLGALLFQELRVLILKRWVIARFFQSNTTHEAIAQRSWRATHREIGSQLAGFFQIGLDCTQILELENNNAQR